MDEIYDKLECIDHKCVGRIPCQGKTIPARIVKVYDGDTITVIYYHGDEVLKTNIRMLGIDAPEVTQKKNQDGYEKKVGLLVRDYLNEICKKNNYRCKVYLEKGDVYGGRVLGRVYINDEDMSEHLLSNGLVKPYDGKSKRTEWQKEELDNICTSL